MESAVGLKKEETVGELQMRLRRVLKGLLKPAKVRSVVITKADKYRVQGVLLMVCPVEKMESGKDFEVGLAGDEDDGIKYVTVDGRRLFPRTARKKASMRGGKES